MSQMIASIVETAQVVDAFFGNFAHSVGLQFYPTPRFVFWGNEDCDIEADASSCEPFADATNTGDYDLILTLGYLACAAMFIPIGRMSLEGNMFFQELSYVITLLCCAQFAYAFYSEGLEFPQNMPLWADNVNWQDLIGVVLFNYAIVTAGKLRVNLSIVQSVSLYADNLRCLHYNLFCFHQSRLGCMRRHQM